LTHSEQIRNFALEALMHELNSLNALPGRINNDFLQLADSILGSNGRVIISGIGKSAIIAQKIVATMNSTGTPAIFMHAADAIHGDLGIVQPQDIVILISKSGNTSEIKALLPLIKRFGNLIAGMTGDLGSELARGADLVIDTTIDREACPNNLAPTTSTSAQLLMGDALAIALLQMRNFSREDFSRFHPGGALGKKLYTTAGDLAERNEKPFVAPDSAVREVISEITGKRLGATAVLSNNTVTGIITDGDIRRMLEKFENIGSLKASDIMTEEPFTCDSRMLAVELSEAMRQRKISQVVVLHEGLYLGMVHIHDLNREGLL